MISRKLKFESPNDLRDGQLLEDEGRRPEASVRDIPEWSWGTAERDICRTEALQTLLALEAGEGLAKVAIEARDITAFSIGHLLHNALRREMICWSGDQSDLFKMIESRIREEGEGPLRNRIQVIRALRDADLVTKGVVDKSLKPAGTTPCIRGVAAIVEDRCKIAFETVISSSRERSVVAARFETIWILRHVCGHSLTIIGKHVGGRDHTTVLNSLNKVNIEMKGDAGYRNSVSRLCEKADLLGIIQSHKILTRQATFTRA